MSSESSNDKVTNTPSSRAHANPKEPDRRVRDKKVSPKRRVSDTDWKRWTDRVRDVFFLVLGLAGTANQLFLANPPNPVLYPILAALLGAPIAFALDDRRRSDRENEDNEK